MNPQNINISGPKIRVLVAPLDWGLGHATRCIPIIRELVTGGIEVLVAADSHSKILLEQEFPGLTFLSLRGYRINYGANGSWFLIKMVLQFPKLMRAACYENRWLKKVIRDHAPDAVISDNRLGLYSSLLPCVYITHQLNIKTGNRFTRWAARKLHYYFINKYTGCWVPDSSGEINLAGSLSHPKRLPKIPVRYLGPLSRFEKMVDEKKYDLAVIVSGPEPQRTVFEDLLLTELHDYNGKVLFVRGLPGSLSIKKCENPKIEIQNHLCSKALNKAIVQSGLIIGRSGYTTVMDLVKLQHRAILIPTPGQTEQEYLGGYLMEKKLFCCMKQSGFTLKGALKKAEDLEGPGMAFDQNEYKKTIADFIGSLVRSNRPSFELKI